MEWILPSKQLPPYRQQVLGFSKCTCGNGHESEMHRLNCQYEDYYIVEFFEKQFHDEKDWWSPYEPDYWMYLPDMPIVSMKKSNQMNAIKISSEENKMHPSDFRCEKCPQKATFIRSVGWCNDHVVSDHREGTCQSCEDESNHMREIEE